MASHRFDATAKRVRVFFRYGQRQYNRTLKVSTALEADRLCAVIEETLQGLGRGKLTMPPEAEPAAFLISGGEALDLNAPTGRAMAKKYRKAGVVQLETWVQNARVLDKVNNKL